MDTLIRQRCLNHDAREAVARCPECREFFCRECVTEHDDRVVCAACLKKLAGTPLSERLRIGLVSRVAKTACGLLLAWVCFYSVGRVLLTLPDDFHEGTVWKRTFWDDK